jgi:hypothetical protein
MIFKPLLPPSYRSCSSQSRYKARYTKTYSRQPLGLHVLPLRHQQDACRLVDPLAARYRVPVCYGVPASAVA